MVSVAQILYRKTHRFKLLTHSRVDSNIRHTLLLFWLERKWNVLICSTHNTNARAKITGENGILSISPDLWNEKCFYFFHLVFELMNSFHTNDRKSRMTYRRLAMITTMAITPGKSYSACFHPAKVIEPKSGRFIACGSSHTFIVIFCWWPILGSFFSRFFAQTIKREIDLAAAKHRSAPQCSICLCKCRRRRRRIHTLSSF